MTNAVRNRRSRMSEARLLGVLALLFPSAGCGNPVMPVPEWAHVQRVTGKVVMGDGRPLSDGKVVLTPQQEPREPLTAWLDSDGTFTLMEGQGLAISRGEFLVHVEPLALPPKASAKSAQAHERAGKSKTKGGQQIPAKYQKPETSGIKVTISPDTKELPPVQLK